ncbi:MAG TPA: lysylphosphatidylglycerol synthase domain-containing protein [Thermoanaerobaculaceae bacterium]|nr:lysylphosphatidylglycerol synthase domain-containing protein [Thermoanaerobaculaceae bacterium]
MTRRSRASWALAGLGVALAAALLIAAEPRRVIALARSASWSGLLVAFAWSVALTTLRGLRLSLLAPGRLPARRAVAVAAVAQFAVGVLPMRLGDLALLPLLAAAGVPGAVRGLSFLVLVRLLDVGAVLVWGMAAAALAGGRTAVLAAAFGALALLAAVAAGAGRVALRLLVRRWRRRPGVRRRALRQALEVRRELRHLARSPLRALACVAVSLLVWAAIWGVSVSLLRAMRLGWPAASVLVGVIGAAVASALPVNAVGTFGSQEAGWSAALAGVGVAPAAALAAGFATHVWTVAFQAVLGLLALGYLLARQPGNVASELRARLRKRLRSGGAA